MMGVEPATSKIKSNISPRENLDSILEQNDFDKGKSF